MKRIVMFVLILLSTIFISISSIYYYISTKEDFTIDYTIVNNSNKELKGITIGSQAFYKNTDTTDVFMDLITIPSLREKDKYVGRFYTNFKNHKLLYIKYKFNNEEKIAVYGLYYNYAGINNKIKFTINEVFNDGSIDATYYSSALSIGKENTVHINKDNQHKFTSSYEREFSKLENN